LVGPDPKFGDAGLRSPAAAVDMQRRRIRLMVAGRGVFRLQLGLVALARKQIAARSTKERPGKQPRQFSCCVATVAPVADSRFK
jgi:hypothetical protein